MYAAPHVLSTTNSGILEPTFFFFFLASFLSSSTLSANCFPFVIDKAKISLFYVGPHRINYKEGQCAEISEPGPKTAIFGKACLQGWPLAGI